MPNNLDGQIKNLQDTAVGVERVSATENKLLQVQPYHWEYIDEASDNNSLEIRIWCLDKDSKPYLLRTEFPAFCFVELPHFVGRNFMRWTADSVHDVVNAITRKLSIEDHPKLFDRRHFSYHRKLYYYRGNNLYPMVMLIFKTKRAMDKCKRRLNAPVLVDGYGTIKCNVWESEINPINKLITKCDVTYTSWIQCDGILARPNSKVSTLELEYKIRWQSISKLPSDVTEGWITKPGILAFDIESYSHKHRMFPDKWNPMHVAYMISCIYQRACDTTRYRYGIILGECKDIPEEDFPNTLILKVSTEEELVRMMGALIIYHDPEVVTGYNIFGFDYPYLSARLERLNQKWPNVSRLKRYNCYVNCSSWSSGGYGHNSINDLKMPGRISVDMLNVIRRDFKLPFYDLNTVSEKFVKKTKHDVSPQDMFRIYELMNQGINAGPGTEEYEIGINKMTEVMLYCIQDSELVLDIMDKINWWIAAVELSSIVTINIYDLFTRGQQVRCDSQLYRLSSVSGYVMDYRPCPDIPFTGGFVGPPTKGLHENILVIDFSSLYPSIIRAYNICYTTLVPDEMFDQISDDDCNIVTIECDEEYDSDNEDVDEEELKEKYKAKGPKGSYRLKFYKKREGLLPKLVGYLCEERNKVKAQLKVEKDPLKKTVLDKRQLALKVSANSFYGFLGVREGGKRPLIEGAMATTAWGRQLIGQVNNYLIDTYGAVIVYGDTDSSMVSMPNQIKHPKDCAYWGQRIAKETSDLFPNPIKMEFENALLMLSLKKKKYAGLYINKDGEYVRKDNGELEVMVKGVLIARRDNCQWTRDVYRTVLMMVLTQEPLVKVIDYLVTEAEKLLKGEIPIHDLEIVKSLGKNYKSETYSMKVFADELRRIGRPAQPGERLKYLVVKRETEHLLGKKMVTPEMYLESQSTENPEVIDYQYYLENMLQNHIDQLISAGYIADIKKLSHIMWRPTNRHGWTDLNNIVKMMVRMIGADLDIRNISNAVKTELSGPKLVILDNPDHFTPPSFDSPVTTPTVKFSPPKMNSTPRLQIVDDVPQTQPVLHIF